MSRRALLQAVSAGALLLAAGCGRKKGPKVAAVPAGAVVLALGDSLTHGTGAAPDESYPAQLAQLSGWQVVNAGVPGDTSAQALERLPALLAEHAPRLVLVGIGGNDLLRRLPEDTTRANLRRICELARAAGAQVLLIAVPRPSVSAAFSGSLADHAMYAETADALSLPLHREGWSQVLADARLRSDQIHANAAGYRHFAERLAAAAREMGLR
ncbi:arylesterase [Aquincola sp. S2]|uniref:Arylesterase n=1 Tax=Pseudaquabacterium terrae TaxID=2732868 RepID=A0ABX2EJZ2_9BURK|nr:GDSL-type esterase/lipase family protein [Aquabacterium terrae]NRF68859.1 arylesterase [Aquabacterium terrae]